MKCWKCGTEQKELPEGKVSFRATCEKCALWLHSCRNCRFYKRGLPNDCMVPGTEIVHDREKYNFCEEFSPREDDAEIHSDPSEAAKKLFGEDATDDLPPKRSTQDRFNSLFDD